MTIDQIWIRIIDSILSGIAFGIFGCILAFARHSRYNVKGLTYAIIFCVTTSLNNFFVAHDLYTNQHFLVLYFGPVASIVKVLFALYCWRNFSEIAIVFRRYFHDHFSRRGFDSIDRQQRSLNVGYIATQTKMRALAALSWITLMRSPAHDNPDSTVGIHTR